MGMLTFREWCPDAYIGGYMLIDVDETTGRMDTMLGSFPPRSVVLEEDDPWNPNPVGEAPSS